MDRYFRVTLSKAVGTAVAALLVAAAPAFSQTTEQGHNITLGGQIVGQRQSQKIGVADASPLNRIDNRVHNRIQNRLRTRIDQSYKSGADGRSSFDVAAGQTRKKQ